MYHLMAKGSRNVHAPLTSHTSNGLLGYHEVDISADEIATLAKDRRAWRNLVIARPQPKDDDDEGVYENTCTFYIVMTRTGNILLDLSKVPDMVFDPDLWIQTCWCFLESSSLLNFMKPLPFSISYFSLNCYGSFLVFISSFADFHEIDIYLFFWLMSHSYKKKNKNKNKKKKKKKTLK